jgi:hypothetical protein
MKISVSFKEPLKLCAPEWNLDLNLIGAGKIDDPFIVSPLIKDNFERTNFSLKILDSKSYTEFRKYNLRAIVLVNCSNKTISNSTFKSIKLVNCSNILLKNVIISKKLILESCHYINIIDSRIHLFDATTSEEILAFKCLFDRVKKRSYSCSLTLEYSKIRNFKSYIQNFNAY